MAGIKEISERTGLSLATVSRVFNNSAIVSDKTKKIVLQAAKELNYRPNQMAAALRSGKSMIVGVLVPEINNYFFGNVINSIEKTLADSGYSVIITQSHESAEMEKKAVESLLKLNVDGILVSTSKHTKDYAVFEKIQAENIPIVFFDRVPQLEHYNAVVLDDHKGGYIATKHLIEYGCKHLVHVMGDTDISIFNKRKEGFVDAVKTYANKVESYHLVSLSLHLKADKKTLSKLFETQPKIDGFFVHGDRHCVHTMHVLRLLGYTIPEDIKLIGFGNNDYTEFAYPKLSTVDQNCNQMGVLAVKTLLTLIDEDLTTNLRQILQPSLVARASSTH